MAEEGGSERRKYTRLATDQVISFAPVDTRDRLAVGKNLSEGGIRFEVVGCEIGLGECIQVTFNLERHTIVATGQVKWATEIDAFTVDVGLEFIDIDPDALRMVQEATSDIEL